MHAKVDANHAGDSVGRRYRMGSLVYLNSALPISGARSKPVWNPHLLDQNLLQ